jgi:hypothetical protein
MPELSTILMLLAVCLIVALLSIRQYNVEVRVRNAVRRLETQNARSLTLAKMAHVEAALTELTDAYDALLDSHKKLRARIGMRKVRADRKENGSDVPDSTVDPAGYKRAMRLKLNQNKL